ncbi:MAG: PcfB family protein [Clostridiales Family XIII bacterium]|nr:PcfB family protein [Clostridiales Family XIII bacterium]
MQEDLENKSVVLTTKALKLTGRGLALLMRAALRKLRQSKGAPKHGRQTVKQLAKGGSLQNIEISDGNIKAFEPFARKFGVSYALRRDDSETPPRWLVFFKAKDADALTAAFKAFSAKMVKRETEKPSVQDSMQKFREVIKNAVRDKTKHKHREGPEL